MQLLTHVLALWSVIATIAYCQGGFPTINTPSSCRAPLPIEWFINNTQTASALSVWASSSLATASKNLSSYIQSQLMVGDTASVIIGTPWGPISEMNFGKLRSNTTGDNQTVNSQSLYRVASTTKVRYLIRQTYIVDLHRSGITHFTAGGEIVIIRFSSKVYPRTQHIVRRDFGAACNSDVWT
jgi:hypothetical protein